jgi:hypothetical protein
MIEILIDGFIRLLANTIFGSPLIFSFVFLFIVVILLLLSRCSIEQAIIFLLIPTYYLNEEMLTGVAGSSVLGILALFNAYILFKNIQKLIGAN